MVVVVVADSTLTGQNTKKIAIFIMKQKTWVQPLDIVRRVKSSGVIARVRNAIDVEHFTNGIVLLTFVSTFALSRHHGKNYGDAIPWNNQIWTVVRAENAIDALNTAYKFWTNEQEEHK